MQTRIICTLGPASTTYEMLHAMVDSGMSYARLNYSHGTPAEHRRWLAHIQIEREQAA